MRNTKLKLIISMFIFGTIGLFRRGISFPSGTLACIRGVFGSVLLFCLMSLTKRNLNCLAVKKNLWVLILSGLFLGLNWMLLFEAYQYASVAAATLAYYMAPVFLVIMAAFLFGESLTRQQGIGCLAAVVGMILISGVFQSGFSTSDFKGIAYGLAAAAFYAGVMLMNKLLKEVPAYEKTMIQLLSAGILLIPYVCFNEIIISSEITWIDIVMTGIVVVLHTGIAYILYFDAAGLLEAKTVALISYLDPLLAVVLSALFLCESFGIQSFLGMILILGATFINEFLS